MSNTHTTKELFAKQLAAKTRRRTALAARPIEEKVAMLVQLQRIAHAIGEAARRVPRKPWEIA